MHNDSYKESLDWLFNQFPSYQKLGSKAYKPTLDNTIALLELLGNPQNDLKFVHVAGSNGKGSVCSFVASALTEANFKVGLFTSPHIKDFSERIRINGTPIDQESTVEFINAIRNATLDFSPSFFEVTFALALEHFKKNKCDICIIETGLGGRLDATNVITPIATAITSISLEHTNILGNTLFEIATEKAGIIKSGIPVVIGNVEPEARDAINEKAMLAGSDVIIPNELSVPEVIQRFLLADYQFENLAIAHRLLEELGKLGYSVSEGQFHSGIENLQTNTGYRGRLQIVAKNPLTILDVSHNPQGFSSTLSAVDKINKGTLHLIMGSSADKDLKAILPLLPKDAIYYITEFGNERSSKLDKLESLFSEINLSSVSYFRDPGKAYNEAKSNAAESDTILVIGSFFLLEHFF
jgi:dihydrofolate synthase/folylpolyglutamate synthase